MIYNKINWQDSPSTATPVNSENLGHMDDGIYENSVAISENTSQLSNISQQKDIYTTLLEEVKDFSTLPSGWVNTSSTWTLGSGKATCSTAGLSNQLITNKTYGLDRRKIRWEFDITTVGSIVAFITKPTEPSIHAGTIIRINATTNNIEIMNQYTGSNVPTVLVTSPIGFSIVTGRRYVVEIEKDGRKLTVRLWDKSGNKYAEYTRTATPWGYATYPDIWGYDQGALQGSPAVAVISGSASIYSFAHTAVGKDSPVLYMLGDSIWEGFSVKDSEKLSTLLSNTLGAEEVQVSSLGGAVSSGVTARLTSELAVIKPKYVMVYLGSNYTATFADDIANIVSIIKSNGAIPIVCTVPTNVAETTAVNALASDILKVKFDLALTESGAGSGYIPKYYVNKDASGTEYNDSLHPNALGNIQMLNRIKLDVPQLFEKSNTSETGWTPLSLKSGMTGTAEYKKIGNLVSIKGKITLSNETTSNSYRLATIPAIICPPSKNLPQVTVQASDSANLFGFAEMYVDASLLGLYVHGGVRAVITNVKTVYFTINYMI